MRSVRLREKKIQDFRIKLKFIENKTSIQPLPILQDFADDPRHNLAEEWFYTQRIEQMLQSP